MYPITITIPDGYTQDVGNFWHNNDNTCSIDLYFLKSKESHIHHFKDVDEAEDFLNSIKFEIGVGEEEYVAHIKQYFGDEIVVDYKERRRQGMSRNSAFNKTISEHISRKDSK